MTNPFQSPSPVDPRESAETPVQRLHRIRKARRRWSIRCWVLGVILIGCSLIYVNLAQSWEVEETSGLQLVSNVIAMMMFFSGIVVILLGPISWFWFFRK